MAASDSAAGLDRHLRLAGFVARCALSVAFATWAGNALGLGHTVWAAMSALIVSHETLQATRTQVSGRVAGTLIGALVALLVHRLGGMAGVAELPQLMIAVSLCALISRGRSALRVCLWTCPLVLLTNEPGEAPESTALLRVVEVLLGALIGGLMHHLEEMLLGRLLRVVRSEGPVDPGSGD